MTKLSFMTKYTLADQCHGGGRLLVGGEKEISRSDQSRRCGGSVGASWLKRDKHMDQGRGDHVYHDLFNFNEDKIKMKWKYMFEM